MSYMQMPCCEMLDKNSIIIFAQNQSAAYIINIKEGKCDYNSRISKEERLIGIVKKAE